MKKDLGLSVIKIAWLLPVVLFAAGMVVQTIGAVANYAGFGKSFFCEPFCFIGIGTFVVALVGFAYACRNDFGCICRHIRIKTN